MRTLSSTQAWIASWASESVPERGSSRVLYWATLINAIGTGMFLVSSAIFFVRFLGLPVTRVGLGLSMGSLIGLVSGVPVGHLADRFGARRVYASSLLAEALAMFSYTLAHSWWTFIAATTAASVASVASSAARGPIIQFLSDRSAAQLKAQLRSVTNAGFFVGAAAAGAALGTGTRLFYLLLILGNAASFAVCALLILAIPAIPAGLSKGSRRSWFSSLRNPTYLRFVTVYGMMSLQYPVLPIVLPLWVLTRTSMPHWIIATMIPVNTILVVTLQMRASRGVTGLRSSARIHARGGAVMSASFVLMALVPALPSPLQAVTLLAAVAVNALGEIFWVTGSYELSFRLAPVESTGQYLGLYSMGGGIGRAVSQALVTYLCLSLGFAGWLVFAVLILIAGVAAILVVNRPVTDETEPAPAALDSAT